MAVVVVVVSARGAFCDALEGALGKRLFDTRRVATLAAAEEMAADASAFAADAHVAFVIDLPGVQGDASTLCEWVRLRDGGGNIPILFAGDGGQSVRSTTDALVAGGDAYVALPAPAHAVVSKIATYTGLPAPSEAEGFTLPGTREPSQEGPDVSQEEPMLPRSSEESSALSGDALLYSDPLPPFADTGDGDDALVDAFSIAAAVDDVPPPPPLPPPPAPPSWSETAATTVIPTLSTAEALPRKKTARVAPVATEDDVIATESSESAAPDSSSDEEDDSDEDNDEDSRDEGTHSEDNKRVARDAKPDDADDAARLLQLRQERERLEAEAKREIAALQRARQERELELQALEEKRARARLAFRAGRLDAVPATGAVAGGADVGATVRVDDGGAALVGGPLVGITTPDREPAPPLPFRAPEPASGSFGDGELPSLLWSCHALEVTGALVFSFEDGTERTLHLEEGEAVLVQSDAPVDRPEEAFLRAGLIVAAQYNVMRAGSPRSARRAAADLVAAGALKTEELFPAVRAVLTEQVLSLLEHGAGTFAFREMRAHASDRVRLEYTLDTLLAEGVRRKYSERRLWAVLGGPATLLGPDDRARALPTLSPEEKLCLARFDGTRSVEDVVLETGVAAVVVLRTALIAVSCGSAQILARGMPASLEERRTTAEQSIAIDRARILDKLHTARNGDYFTFLGIDTHATTYEAQRAVERVRQRFDPQRFMDPAFADLRAAISEILDVAHDAEAVLGDEALADGYRHHLFTGENQLQRRRA